MGVPTSSPNNKKLKKQQAENVKRLSKGESKIFKIIFFVCIVFFVLAMILSS